MYSDVQILCTNLNENIRITGTQYEYLIGPYISVQSSTLFTLVSVRIIHTTYIDQYKYVQTGRWQGSVAAWVHKCCVPGTPSLWLCRYYYLWVHSTHVPCTRTRQHTHRRAQRCRDLNSWSSWLRDCWRISTYFFQVTNKTITTNQPG